MSHNNRILHVDGDSFFASCEIALNPKLQERAVWVGGGRRGDGIVIAATARIYDVLCWMKRSKAAKIHMEKLRERKAAKAARLTARRQRAATRRLFNE
jgi:nucleotidyltransferase/DNA polymerase involved in DNA repair